MVGWIHRRVDTWVGGVDGSMSGVVTGWVGGATDL